MEVVAGENEYEVGVEDLVVLIKSEGLYLAVSKNGDLQIHPTGVAPRDEVMEIIEENADALIEWLSFNEYCDS